MMKPEPCLGLMSINIALKLTLLLLLLLNFVGMSLVLSADDYNRNDFPTDFVFGSGTSAYQWEGAVNEDGRTPSIWDTYAHAGFVHGDNADIACDGYHKYKEDVKLMVETGLDAYRLSISWSRLIPNGRGPINPKGLQFYNNSRGDSTTEPYLAVHHILLSHSSAVRLYRRKYKDKQHGFIGIAVYSFGFIPANDTDEDWAATQRARDFFIGWILGPLVHGDYPISMKTNAGSRIPTFSDRESAQLKGSCDFIGVIFYDNLNITDNSIALKRNLRDYDTDMAAQLIFGPALFSNEEYPVTPWTLREELNIMKILYGNPPIFIYENGQRTPRNSSLQDVKRVEYLHGYIGAVLDSIRDGSNIKGYFAWSFMDVFELLDGYNASFGLYYVDRDDPKLKRYPKLSAEWYGNFLKGGNTSGVGAIELEKDSSLVSIGRLSQ
ncbi:hydroxyisourate hydrolase isoform X3 [Arachis ipaensis]|uniref:hydroxyisourate hydrolase isoform X3 n=1 Tax=Arachis ipaensis TaxID=130454 RepID=UPI000A2B0353|nr:hydroxyisourate hydrolase isoform X3 [Arachis ipaensis]